jgi:hypothetical protein
VLSEAFALGLEQLPIQDVQFCSSGRMSVLPLLGWTRPVRDMGPYKIDQCMINELCCRVWIVIMRLGLLSAMGDWSIKVTIARLLAGWNPVTGTKLDLRR